MKFPALKWVLTSSIKDVCTVLWRTNFENSYRVQHLWQCVDRKEIAVGCGVSPKSTEIQKTDLLV